MIAEGSSGVPFYLHLSVDTYERIKEKRQPTADDFGKTQPEIVLSVGPNFMWEFFKIFWDIGRSILGGLVIVFCSAAVSLIVVLIITLKRSRFRKELKGYNAAGE